MLKSGTTSIGARRALWTVVALMALAALTAGCGSSGGNDTTQAGNTSSVSSSPEGGEVAVAQKNVEQLYKGTYRDPGGEPLSPKPNQNIWVLSCGQALESCAVPAQAATEAGEALGWNVTVFDGKLNPDAYNAGVRQAIADKADGIVVVAIDCRVIYQALEQAHKAGLKIVSLYSIDCNEPPTNGPSLFDAEVIVGDYTTTAEWASAWTKARADWIIAKTDGKAKVIQIVQDDIQIVAVDNVAFQEEMAKCAECEIVDEVKITVNDLGPSLTQKIQSALLQNPDANAVFAPYDGLILGGLGAGITASGMAHDLQVMGGELFPSNVEIMRSGSGEEDAANAVSTEWFAWAAMDDMNSVLQGKEPRPSGLGWQLVDMEHNLPEAGQPYVPLIDYQAAYERLWSGS